MNKKVLLLCTDNSALSIFGEAVLNKYLPGVEAYSAGVINSTKINPNVKTALVKDGSWSDKFTSKNLNEMMDVEYDLVIILSQKATKASSNFGEKTVVIEIEYEEPNYENSTNIDRFIKTIKMELIPITRDILEL
ncbi:arsenate reductase ArsC [Sulfurimonas sp.]|mgnify:FL=1|uniref:arsenate reductase/protein-tyrosine-phosphatase family protein n=1 Tax=Sulfurimonas sp. TaxID=2022749 RepID=UPI0025D0417E|nr:arsenate reductase ArsC [Sulfurimonas sp.]MBT5935239.1 arsenate reductase ArsC [Sulfurimonas sp.]